MLEEIIFGIKVDVEETESSKPADGNASVQVPPEDNSPEPANLDPVKLQLDIKAAYQCPSVAFMLEELPTSKSRLSPLAARAALASFVSTAYDGANGTELDDHQITKNLSFVDNCSLEDPYTLVPLARETVNLVKKSSLDENRGSLKPQLEKSTELSDASVRSKRSTAEWKSVGVAKTGRVTRSSIQKANSSVMNAEDIPRSSSADSEGLALPSGFKGEANLTFKEGEEDADLIQITKSGNSKTSKPKKSAVTRKQGQELSEMKAGTCTPSQEVGERTSSFAFNNQPTEGKVKCQSVKRKLFELQVPGRVTRSAVQKAAENADNGLRGESCDEEVKEGVSKKKCRSIGSSGLVNAENFTGSQGVDKGSFFQGTKSDNSEMNLSEEEKKETLSSQMALVGQTPVTETVKAKTSSSTKKAQQTEGKLAGRTVKSHEQNKKLTSDSKQERRFSPRLRFLPRTRSQVKS